MILLIDTSQQYGTVAIAREGKILQSENNDIAKEHASWLHPAIGRILAKEKITLRDLKAVAVVAGPGSYTGLRVAMAAAKGFCYALKIPLITQSTLLVMAESMRFVAEDMGCLICPMIDARRDEVFTALYQGTGELRPWPYSVIDQPSTVNRQPSTAHDPLSPVIGHRSSVIDPGSSVIDLIELLPPQAMILDKKSFEEWLTKYYIVFFGSGLKKWAGIKDDPELFMLPQLDIKEAFATLSQQDFASGKWADPVYAEPIYLKEFFSY